MEKGKYRIRRATQDDFELVHQLYSDGLKEVIPKMYREKVFASIPHQIFFACCSLMAIYFLDVQSFISFTAFYVGFNAVLCIIVYVEFIDTLDKRVITEGKNLHKFISMFSYKEKLNFWVAETVVPSTPQIIGCVGVTHNDVDTMPRNVGLYRLMKKYGMKSSFEIKRMSVDRSHRKNGAAQMIMKALTKCIKEDYGQTEDIVLATTDLQQPAIRLYKRFGFTEMSPLLTVKNRYSRTSYDVHFFRLSLANF